MTGRFEEEAKRFTSAWLEVQPQDGLVDLKLLSGMVANALRQAEARAWHEAAKEIHDDDLETVRMGLAKLQTALRKLEEA